MRALGRRVAVLDQRLDPLSDRGFLAYARAVVAYGGGDPTGEAAVGLARWLEAGRRAEPCGPG